MVKNNPEVRKDSFKRIQKKLIIKEKTGTLTSLKLKPSVYRKTPKSVKRPTLSWDSIFTDIHPENIKH